MMFVVILMLFDVYMDGHFRIVYYSRIAIPNPILFFPTMHCTWE